MTLGDMLHSGEWEALADAIDQRFSCKIDPSELRRICGNNRKYWPTDQCSNKNGLALGDTVMWLKVRLWDRMPQAQRRPKIVEFKTTFHVFFLFLDETPEMLARLRRDDEEIKRQIARSKISSTTAIIAPIDRVASRVVKAIEKRKHRETYEAIREQRRQNNGT